jgi:hypothetical protein
LITTRNIEISNPNSKFAVVKFKSFVSNAQLVSMAESYFLLLDVASVSWDISSDFLNRASHSEFTLHTAANAENNDCSKKTCMLFATHEHV